MKNLVALARQWIERSAQLRPYAPAAAEAFAQAASELESAAESDAATPLTIAEACAESGFSGRRLRELIASGEIPNAGRRGRPRIRRGDLPRKPRRQSPGVYDPVRDAAELVARNTGR